MRWYSHKTTWILESKIQRWMNGVNKDLFILGMYIEVGQEVRKLEENKELERRVWIICIKPRGEKLSMWFCQNTFNPNIKDALDFNLMYFRIFLKVYFIYFIFLLSYKSTKLLLITLQLLFHLTVLIKKKNVLIKSKSKNMFVLIHLTSNVVRDFV